MPEGPCTLCGAKDYALSLGGPSVCPRCDAGVFDDPALATKRMLGLKPLATEEVRLVDFPSPLDATTRELILRQHLARQEPLSVLPVLGAATGLDCPSCGGVLHDPIDIPFKLYKGPPHSKNRRIRKKQFKRWLETTRPLRMMNIMLGAMRPRGWVCSKCSRRVGFYQGIGHNLIKVESMPRGAALTYYRDPE